MAYFVEFHLITKILLEKLRRIFNYQKVPNNCEILPKVIKIPKSGHIVHNDGGANDNDTITCIHALIDKKFIVIVRLRHTVPYYSHGDLLL